MATYVFAYGTLQPGLAPDAVRPWVDRLEPVGTGVSPGWIYDLGEYPGAVFGGSGVVHGTVYGVPAAMETTVLAAFDAYEGVPDLYVRLAVPVVLADGRTLTCWAYQYNRDLAGRAPIASGRYVREPRP